MNHADIYSKAAGRTKPSADKSNDEAIDHNKILHHQWLQQPETKSFIEGLHTKYNIAIDMAMNLAMGGNDAEAARKLIVAKTTKDQITLICQNQ